MEGISVYFWPVPKQVRLIHLLMLYSRHYGDKWRVPVASVPSAFFLSVIPLADSDSTPEAHSVTGIAGQSPAGHSQSSQVPTETRMPSTVVRLLVGLTLIIGHIAQVIAAARVAASTGVCNTLSTTTWLLASSPYVVCAAGAPIPAGATIT